MKPYQETKTCGECTEAEVKTGDKCGVLDSFYLMCRQSKEAVNPDARACPLFEPKEQE